jgi:transcriptional regulator with XRE-family HTH domain
MASQQNGTPGESDAAAELDGPWRNPPKGGPWELFFVENMRRLREKARMTQTDLAKALKARGLPFHQPTIQRIENGDRPVRLNEAFAIADELDCDLETMTSHLISEAEDITLGMERISRAYRSILDNLLEDYGSYVEKIAEFAVGVWPALPDWPKDNEGRLTFTAAEHFDDLPDNFKIGLAFLARLEQIGSDLLKAIMGLADFVGDRTGETRPDVWELQFPDDEVMSDIRAWTFELDCQELRELSTRSLTALYTATIRHSMKEAQAPNETVEGE